MRIVARLLALAALAVALVACGASGGMGTSATQANDVGTEAVTGFFTTLQKPEADRKADLEKLLAPEFQIVRAEGDDIARADYIASPPSVTTFTIANVNATVAGDSLVVAYQVETTETLNGVEQTTTAPRLSTFRKIDGSWRLVAHANFGAIK